MYIVGLRIVRKNSVIFQRWKWMVWFWLTLVQIECIFLCCDWFERLTQKRATTTTDQRKSFHLRNGTEKRFCDHWLSLVCVWFIVSKFILGVRLRSPIEWCVYQDSSRFPFCTIEQKILINELVTENLNTRYNQPLNVVFIWFGGQFNYAIATVDFCGRKSWLFIRNWNISQCFESIFTGSSVVKCIFETVRNWWVTYKGLFALMGIRFCVIQRFKFRKIY